MRSLPLDPRAQAALRDPATRFELRLGGQSRSPLQAECFEGSLITVARLTLEGVAAWQN